MEKFYFGVEISRVSIDKRQVEFYDDKYANINIAFVSGKTVRSIADGRLSLETKLQFGFEGIRRESTNSMYYDDTYYINQFNLYIGPSYKLINKEKLSLEIYVEHMLFNIGSQYRFYNHPAIVVRNRSSLNYNLSFSDQLKTLTGIRFSYLL